VLEVGCGPGHLSIRLARQPGLDVTGLDLDPAMIERARANADRAGSATRAGALAASALLLALIREPSGKARSRMFRRGVFSEVWWFLTLLGSRCWLG
jgi:SAM-dependent methyltransferase